MVAQGLIDIEAGDRITDIYGNRYWTPTISD